MRNKVLFTDITYLLAVISFMLVPLPIFFDFKTFSFAFIQEPFFSLSIPVPIGLISFSFAMLMFFLNHLISPQYYKLVISRKKVRGVVLLIFVILFAWLLFIAQSDIFRIIQMTLPLVFLLLLVCPESFEKQKRLAVATLTSVAVFIVLHSISLLLNDEKITTLNEYDTSLFFSYGIYQAFVSYSGVLGLYSFMFLVAALQERKIIKKTFIFAAYFISLFLMCMLARRANLIEFIFYISIGFVFGILYIFKEKLTVTKNYLLNVVLLLFTALLLPIFSNLPLVTRALSSAQTDTFDSGRIDIYKRALQEMLQNPYETLVGYGGKSGFHNYLLDLIYTVGLMPMLITMFVLFVAFFKLRLKKIYEFVSMKNYVAIILFFLILLQIMINSSLTQPYYLINLILIFFFIARQLQEKFV